MEQPSLPPSASCPCRRRNTALLSLTADASAASTELLQSPVGRRAFSRGESDSLPARLFARGIALAPLPAVHAAVHSPPVTRPYLIYPGLATACGRATRNIVPAVFGRGLLRNARADMSRSLADARSDDEWPRPVHGRRLRPHVQQQ